MTPADAIALGNTKFWEKMSAREIALFQLYTELLCMPFEVFHGAMEEALGRPVWTHEFGTNVEGLKLELLGRKNPPTMEEIINLIPADKRVFVVTT